MDWYFLEETYQTIKQHKVRTVLTGFGIMWGIFSLVILIGMGNGLKTGVYRRFEGMARNSMLIRTQNFGSEQPLVLNLKLLDALKKFKEIKEISPQMVSKPTHSIFYKDFETSNFLLIGGDKSYCHIRNLTIDLGRDLNNVDINLKRQVCIIGERIKNDLFHNSNPIGKTINVNGAGFKVIGVMQGKGKTNEFTKTGILTPYTIFRDLFLKNDDFSGLIWILLDSKVNAQKYGQKIINFSYNYLRANIKQKESKALTFWSLKSQLDKIQSLFKTIDGFVWFVCISFLLGGAVGIGNMMLVVIKERTQEIGIRKVIGAKPQEILNMILGEAILITICAGIFGILIGLFAIKVINIILDQVDPNKQMMLGHLSFDLISAILSLMIILVSGIIAGYIPAKRATDLLPIEALKDE